jgi:gas vesicle protein
MRGFLSFFSGALLGAMVGVSAAILFAPTSGDDLQRQFKDRIEQVQFEVRQAAANRRTELEQQLAVLRAPGQSGQM